METPVLVSTSDRARIRSDIQKAVEWLAGFGSDPSGGVTRLLYDDAWIAAQHAVADKMKEFGLDVRRDDCGNVFGRLHNHNPEEEGVLLTGSHIDTVISGGKYDGAYGILAGMIALRYLREQFGVPLVNLEVVSLSEEEGSRFPLTYWGSGNIAGKYGLDRVPPVKDDKGIALEDAMKKAGFASGSYSSPIRSDLSGFIELHIEQGSILETEKKSMGIVKNIVGQRRYTVQVSGSANHAGTTPMYLRQDALSGACEMVQKLEESARSEGGQFVATTGYMNVSPNLSNVIPEYVKFTVDVRDADAEVLERFSCRFQALFKEIAALRRLQIQIEEWMNVPPVPMYAPFNETMADICKNYGFSYREMNSGAGHDAQIFQGVCPTTMLFIPSRHGISHSPLEYSDPEDLTNGIIALIDWLYRYGYQGVSL